MDQFQQSCGTWDDDDGNDDEHGDDDDEGNADEHGDDDYDGNGE